jgi:hypothetical protein
MLKVEFLKMKKISLLFFAFLGIALFSCNNSPELGDVLEDVIIKEPAEEFVTRPSIPNFENSELREFTEEFSIYFDESMELLRNGDVKGLADLDEKGKALQMRAELLKDEVSDADNALLEEYLKGKAIEMLSASELDNIPEKM